MPNESVKSAVGRQTQLPFKRAFEISLKSLRIRFWRSMITAGGIFLGIAFLTVVLTQSLMQWPVPEKVSAGYVRVDGQVNAPGDFEAWTPVRVEEGLKAGIPEDVIKRVADENGTFPLRVIVQGKIDARRADVNLRRVEQERKGLWKIKDALAFYVSAAADADLKIADAIKYGVPKRVAHSLALLNEARKELEAELAKSPNGKETRRARQLREEMDFYLMAAIDKNVRLSEAPGKARKMPKDTDTFKGSDLGDVVREQPNWINPLYSGAVLDQDINVEDGVKCGVPRAIARYLAGEGRTFRAGPLNDVIKGHDRWVQIWRRRAERNAIFKTVPDNAIAVLAKTHARTLNDILADAKKVAEDADLTNVMVVNKDRKIKADFARDGKAAGVVKLQDGDNVYVPDRNSRYRMIWLVVMSLLVCMVGITNSMLMAVTERYKEIGTMKCLGALDKFVVELFMLESGMMGIVASVLGWLVGFIVIVVLAGATRGWDLVANMEAMDILKTFGQAVAVGLLLTIIATIAPAKRAADMPPAMALRSEI
ncbi:MAG: FtsX-like permease family protein [Armatimonadetes bacterium]|nr:FtsX-like permease family protein [Armatimonadota bacterium]